MYSNVKKFFPILIAFMMLLSFFPGATIATTNETSSEITIEDVQIEMRDGVKLSAKVYRPSKEGQYPVLLTRTPYNSARDYINVGKTFAQKGYAVVVNDVRGLYGSDGVYRPYMDDANDGYDTVAWAHEQPWSNGKVGTFGSSARGITQSLLGPEQPPGLEAMYWVVTPSRGYEETMFQGGAYRHELVTQWLAGVNYTYADSLYKKGELDSNSVVKAGVIATSFPNLYWQTPLKSLPLEWVSFAETFDHYIKDGYYDYRDITQKYSSINVPVYHVGGWYDIFAEGTIKNFIGLQQSGGKGAKGNQKLVMGPWEHREISADHTDSDLFEGDEFSNLEEMERWFDYWMKDIDNGIMDEDPVKYYTMGTSEWKTAKKWEVPSSTQKKMYFHSETTDNVDSLNNGTLSSKMAGRHQEPDVFKYDPADPIVTIGGQNLYPASYGVGPMDQRPAEKDSLTYTTDVLKEDVEITGNIEATLYVSSDAKDTDFTVKLTDVAPDGTSTLINDGIQRMRFREGLEKEVFMEDGEVYKIEVNLNDTSHVFKKGHKIRVAVASSNFPRFDRNTNTGNPLGVDTEEDFVIATNKIYHSPKYPSHITLPVIKNK